MLCSLMFLLLDVVLVLHIVLWEFAWRKVKGDATKVSQFINTTKVYHPVSFLFSLLSTQIPSFGVVMAMHVQNMSNTSKYCT